MMKAALILLAACLGAVSAQYMMQVNYYEAQQCGYGWMNSVDISTGDNGACLAYNIPGAGSFNIANCYEQCFEENDGGSTYTQCNYQECYCLFFTGSDCTGENAAYVGVDSNGNALANNNCANTGETWWEPVSIKCWWSL
jgi:hypothetical protein